MEKKCENCAVNEAKYELLAGRLRDYRYRTDDLSMEIARLHRLLKTNSFNISHRFMLAIIFFISLNTPAGKNFSKFFLKLLKTIWPFLLVGGPIVIMVVLSAFIVGPFTYIHLRRRQEIKNAGQDDDVKGDGNGGEEQSIE